MQTQYTVDWTPWKAVRAAAVQRGWTENDSAADFVEIDHYSVTEVFPSFAKALRRARMVEIHDTWGCPRIERQAKDDDSEWLSDARWEVLPGEPDPLEASPDVDLTLECA